MDPTEAERIKEIRLDCTLLQMYLCLTLCSLLLEQFLSHRNLITNCKKNFMDSLLLSIWVWPCYSYESLIRQCFGRDLAYTHFLSVWKPWLSFFFLAQSHSCSYERQDQNWNCTGYSKSNLSYIHLWTSDHTFSKSLQKNSCCGLLCVLLCALT